MTKYDMKEGVKLPTPEDSRMKRFYKDVSVDEHEGSWRVLLDGRSVKTPAKKSLAVPTRALAQLIADEWDAQEERIDPPKMPASRLAFVALDFMCETHVETAAEVAKYASTDLLCFRAPEPMELVVAQKAAWDPMLVWATDELGVTLKAVQGVLPVDQDPVALQIIHARASKLDDFRLTALAHVTALCSSAILGFGLLEGKNDGETTFALSTIDEAFQISTWGKDDEGEFRLNNIKHEIVVAGKFLRALDE